MLDGQQGREYHERFKELNALASSGTLTPLEWYELNSHLEHCEECSEVAFQYHILATEEISPSADAYTDRLGHASWDEEATLERLLVRVRTARRTALERDVHAGSATLPSVLRRIISNSFTQAPFAECRVA